MDLGRLRISHAIVHEVPYRLARSEAAPNLSETEPSLNSELKNYFRERIASTLVRAASDVVFDPTSTSPVPAIVRDRLSRKGQGFVAASQAMAHHLNSVQSGNNSGGLLVATEGTLEGLACVAILKLEKEQGVRVEEKDVRGKHILSLEHVRELMLTEHTRVFKVGLFWTDTQSKDSVGQVSDNQQQRSEIADFFLRQYLGCMLTTAPDVVTKRFMDSTEAFVNREVADPERKARYQIALLSEMKREVGTISPRTFAAEHLELADRQPFIDALADNGVDSKRFRKDTELIANRIRRMQLEFESGLTLLAPPEVVKERVRMETRDDEQTHVEFEDRLKNIHAKR